MVQIIQTVTVVKGWYSEHVRCEEDPGAELEGKHFPSVQGFDREQMEGTAGGASSLDCDAVFDATAIKKKNRKRKKNLNVF